MAFSLGTSYDEPDYGAWGAPLNPITWSDPYTNVANAPQQGSGGAFGGGIAFGGGGNMPNPYSAPAPTGSSTATFGGYTAREPAPSYATYAAPQPGYQPAPQSASISDNTAQMQAPPPMQQQQVAPPNLAGPNLQPFQNPSNQLNIPGPGSGPNPGGLPPGLAAFVQSQGSAGPGGWTAMPGQPSPMPNGGGMSPLQGMLQQIMRGGPGGPPNSAIMASNPQQMVPPPPPDTAQYNSGSPMVNASTASMQMPQEAQQPGSGGIPQDPIQAMANAAIRLPRDLAKRIAGRALELQGNLQAVDANYQGKIQYATEMRDHNLARMQAQVDQEAQPEFTYRNPADEAIREMREAARAAYNASTPMERAAAYYMAHPARNPYSLMRRTMAPMANKYQARLKAASDREVKENSLEARQHQETKAEHVVLGYDKLSDNWQKVIDSLDKQKRIDKAILRNTFKDQVGFDIKQAQEQGKLTDAAAHRWLGEIHAEQQDEVLEERRVNHLSQRLIDMQRLGDQQMRTGIMERNASTSETNAETAQGNLAQRKKELQAKEPLYKAQEGYYDSMSGGGGLEPLPGESQANFEKRMKDVLSKVYAKQGWKR